MTAAATTVGNAYAAVRASWLARLETTSALPERTVLVRNEATAHSWRRDLIAANRSDLLIGTRFITPLAAATQLLEMSRVAFENGEESVRPARIATLLAKDVPFRAFDPEVLRGRPGWANAIASTIGTLESAGHSPETLRASSDARCHDLAELWSRLDVIAGASWTAARTLREATTILQASPARWMFGGPCLVEVTGHETTVQANWLGSIPDITLTYVRVRPHRAEHARRVQQLFADVAVHELKIDGCSERELLARHIFAPPEMLADPARPRSTSIDGTVHFEEHAGIEEELDAAVSWVIHEIGDLATPLEQIGIVVPRIDPYASLLAERFESLGQDSVHVVGGLPAAGTSSGARIVTVLRALATYLHIDTMAEVLPILRLSKSDLHISRRDAIALLYELGTVGGSTANPEGALDWFVRRTKRHATLSNVVDDERSRTRTVEQLEALVPPLEALDRVARTLIANGSLGALWGELQVLCRDHVRLGTDGKRILAAVDVTLAPLIAAEILTGEAALEAIATTLESMRLPVGRFGEARISIVALLDAVGMSFESVRVMGLAEGVVPATVREDPVLPDLARATLDGVRRSGDRTLAEVHALHRVLLAVGERVVLSVPKMDVDGRYREPSGVLIEAAAAISRAPLGTNDRFIPDGHLMRRGCFAPGRAALVENGTRWPVDDRGRLLRAAHSRAIPASWNATAHAVLAAAMDGWFPEGAFVDLPGLSAARPISASALGRLLECPHRFLYERVLGWNAPSELLDEGTVDALSYGSLFHETAETFYRDHGASFCANSQTLADWQRIARDIADTSFDTFIDRYPLVGTEVRNAQRARLRRDLATLLDSDWSTAKTFVDVERSFGPMSIELGGETVHVRGFIDRIDTVGTASLVRDLKTGRAKPREKVDDLRPAYDVQLGLYGLVVRAKAAEWGVPSTIQGAYVYPSDPAGDDRSFVDDFDDLAKMTERWIGTAVRLLKVRRFPRTPIESDCQFCPFKPVCGPHAQARAAELLSTTPDLSELAALKNE